MIKVKATCESLSAILMNPMTPEMLESLLRKTPMPKPGRDATFEEITDPKVIRHPETGEPGLPAEYLLAALVEAGRHVKVKSKQVSTAGSTILYSFMAINEPFLVFTDYDGPTPDCRRGTNPNGGEAVVLLRPKFARWAFEVEIEIDDKKVEPSTVRELLNIAGSAVGVGDFRPAKRGPFGRFKVAHWVVLESTAADADTEAADDAVPATSNGHGRGELVTTP